jgi:peptide/nickel transport system permease protein
MFRKKKYTTGQSLQALAWKRLKNNKLAVAAMLLILVTALVAVLGYIITPDSTPYANRQHIEISAQKPGFRVSMIKQVRNAEPQKQSYFNTMLNGKRSAHNYIPVNDVYFDGDVLVYTGFDPFPDSLEQEFRLMLADVVFALNPDAAAPWINNESVFYTLHNGQEHSILLADLREEVEKNHLIRRTFILGSDRYGRDVLSQLMIGTRISLSVGFISVGISLIIGIFIGALGGYFRGWIDTLVVWLINVVWSIPTLLLVIAITFALGKGFWQVFIAVGLTMWVEVARVVRGQVMSIREKEYIEAARALGFRYGRIIFRHILPNVAGPVIVISAANFASAILIEAGLSFLGLGVQPPMPSWGTMIKENYAYIILGKAHLAILPGIAIMLMVLAFMIIGNGLRDALDIKTIDKPGTIGKQGV